MNKKCLSKDFFLVIGNKISDQRMSSPMVLSVRIQVKSELSPEKQDQNQ